MLTQLINVSNNQVTNINKENKEGEVLLTLTPGGAESSPAAHIVVHSYGFNLKHKISLCINLKVQHVARINLECVQKVCTSMRE